MIRLNETQISKKTQFISKYMSNMNAADSSKMDSNANVSLKNISTLESEIHKDINIQVNRHLDKKKI